MKRKRGQQQQPPKRKRTSDTAADAATLFIREGLDFTSIHVPPGEAVVLTGSAVLEVTSGCFHLFGSLITPERGPVRLNAPIRHRRGLLLTAVPAEAQAPLAQPTTPVQAVLHSVSAAADTPSFAVVNASSPEAPACWQVPAAWSEAAGSVSAAPAAAAASGAAVPPIVVAVTGSKGSGKSAFARLLTNSLLNSCGAVAFVDLDPGQPELTPPGLLSLHVLHQPLFGPAHLQQQQPMLACFQGDVSPQSEPGRYLQAVQALCSRYYSLAAAQQPLVINTPGWVTGLGLELLAEALRCAAPSHVVSMCSSTGKKNLPDGCWWQDGAAAGSAPPVVLQVQSVAAAGAAGDTPAKGAAEAAAAAAAAGSCFSEQSGDTVTTVNPSSSHHMTKGLPAVETRALSWLSWAKRVIRGSLSAQANQATHKQHAQDGAATAVTAASDAAGFAEAAEGLAAAAPYQVCLQDLKVELQHAQVPQNELAMALNGSIVGLVSSSSSSSDGRRPEQQQQQQQLLVGSGGGLLPECLGIGLVRAVDAPKGLLYLLTDLNEEQLQQVDTLVLGRLELPDKLLVTQRFAAPYQGLFCLTTTATGAGVIKSRNNLLRTSLMRGS